MIERVVEQSICETKKRKAWGSFGALPMPLDISSAVHLDLSKTHSWVSDSPGNSSTLSPSGEISWDLQTPPATPGPSDTHRTRSIGHQRALGHFPKTQLTASYFFTRTADTSEGKWLPRFPLAEKRSSTSIILYSPGKSCLISSCKYRIPSRWDLD